MILFFKLKTPLKSINICLQRSIFKSKIAKKANDNIKNLLYDKEYTDLFPEIKENVKSIHKVLAIQPNAKSSRTSTAHLELSELCALVQSIPLWSVTKQMIEPLKRVDKHKVFGSGKLEELTSYIKQIVKRDGVSAVVLGLNSLSSSQLVTLQQMWGLPVYDRFSVILEIFRARAKTNEAKMQVALAEISYLKANLYSLHHGTLGHHNDVMEMIGGTGETYINTRKHLLRERETRIKKEVLKIVSQKEMFRSSRKKLELPVIAVVGYTNAGKTSLIKCLTRDSSLTPEDRLFATLDVTAFTGYLPNKLKVLYLDTIGFVSNIPPSLFNAFSASLQDILHADLIMVVGDCSHPDKTTQDRVVIETLENIIKNKNSSFIHPLDEKSINPSFDPSTNPFIMSSVNQISQKYSSTHPLLQNIVFVHNKADLLNSDERASLKSSIQSPSEVITSLTDGWGVVGEGGVEEVVQEALLKVTYRTSRKLRVPVHGAMLPWLYKEAIIENIKSDPCDPEKYLMEVSMTPVVAAKFNNKFKIKK